MLIPSKIAAKLFYNDDYDHFLYITGQFNGEEVLNGIYKFFIKMASIDYVMDKASLIFETYYSEGSISINSSDKKFIITINGFKKDEEKWFINIAGWIDSLTKLVSKKKKQYKISWKTLYNDKNDNVTGEIYIELI